MEFGIMAMQLGELIPAGDPQAALTQLAGFRHANLVRKLASFGFRWIELGGDLGMFLPQAYSPQAILELAALKTELGIQYTVHLPLWSVEPSTPQPAVRAGSVQAVVQSIQATLPLEPQVYVLHATGALAAEFYRMRIPEIARAYLLRQFQAGAQASLQTILQETGIAARRLAIETIEFPFELTLELANSLDLSICLDTGHILAGFSGPVELFDVLEQVLPRLAEIHLHDCPWQGPEMKIGYGKDHQALGKGDLDTLRLLNRLRQAHFNGPIIFELSIPEALQSMQVIHQLEAL